MNCKYCNSTTFYNVFVPFKNPAWKTAKDPKYSFHIAEICINCNRHIRFLKQTDELMEKLDHAIMLKNFDLQPRIPND